MSAIQETADELFKEVVNDFDKIFEQEKIHGRCLRLFKSGHDKKWLFEDGYMLEIPGTA